MELKITIYGNPVVKARPKFFITPMSDATLWGIIHKWENSDKKFNLANLIKRSMKGAGRYIRAYSPQKKEEQEFIDKLEPQLKGHKIFEGGVEVISWFGMPRPKSHYGTGRNAGILKKSAPVMHLIKPDKDNLEKFFMDFFNNRVWNDDKQVVKTISEKVYALEPRTEIIVREVR